MVTISNLLKYCLGYMRLTSRRSYAAQDKFAVFLDKETLDLSALLQSDVNESRSCLINLPVFYSVNPKELKPEMEKQYRKEKLIAEKIEEIYNKYKNDEFTKQITLNFGYYEIELPPDIENLDTPEEMEEQLRSKSKSSSNGASLDLFTSQQPEQQKSKIERHPLFSIPILVDKEGSKYYIRPADPEIQPNISVLEPIMGEERLLQVVEEFGRYERVRRVRPTHQQVFAAVNGAWDAPYKTEAKNQYEQINNSIRQYLTRMNIPERLLDIMNSTSPDKVKWIDKDNNEDLIEELHLVGEYPVYAEEQDSQYAKSLKISKKEFYERRARSEDICKPILYRSYPNVTKADGDAYNACNNDIMHGRR